MHGEKIHEDRGIDRRYPSQKGRGGDKSCDWRELWSEPEAGKGAHQPSKSKGTDGGGGVCPASQGTAAQGSGQRRDQTAQGTREAANAGGVAAKFSVRSWKEVKLKYRVMERFRGKYSVETMCEVFEVSRSGYYAWRKRQERGAKNQWLADLIVDCQKKCKQTYGIRRVRRWIQRQTGKEVNLKAILRLMRKLNLLSVVRRRRPYTRYQQAVHKYPNLLNRRFDQPRPNQFWVTDITYIPIPGGMLYMCAVLDLCGKVVLNWKIGSEMSSSLVTDAIRETLQQEKVTDGLALHSDQGSQYTSKAYFDLTQAYHVSPSMSSPGCPYDNAAMENFFGTLKTECLYRARFSSRAEVKQLVAEYIHFYNFERISLKNGLTPLEIRGKTA